MNKYIGVKLIEAEPMSDIDFESIVKGWPIEVERKPKEGYKVVYPDGYVSWSPKEVFEAAYMQVGDNNMIRQEDVDNFIQEVEAETWGDKTTVVHATLNNGFIITESSSCVDPTNFDFEIGRDICLEKIKDKVWGFLGFLLQCGVKGVKGK